MRITGDTRRAAACLGLLLCGASLRAEVRVFVEDINGLAGIQYQCTAGEIVRAFALNVSVDQGQIIGVTNFFRGQSTAAARGYGIFPAAFRDYITVTSGTNVNFNVPGYTPLADVSDRPGDTLPGINSSGVTLEFGALWDPALPAAAPDAAGTLCALQLSQAAQVSITTNSARGGLVSAVAGLALTPVFTGGFVDPNFPFITGITASNGVIIVTFRGGELLTAPTVMGPWSGTGNTNGFYTNSLGAAAANFFRVRRTSSVSPAPAITGLTLSAGILVVSFQGGELITAPGIGGPWSGTGNTNGFYTNAVSSSPAMFYRVRQ